MVRTAVPAAPHRTGARESGLRRPVARPRLGPCGADLGLATVDSPGRHPRRDRPPRRGPPRVAGPVERLVMSGPPEPRPLSRLSVVIPARDEEGCICSTVEHLHVELRLHNVLHEIVVVDDGSTDRTWALLLAMRERIPELVPVQNLGLHGF